MRRARSGALTTNQPKHRWLHEYIGTQRVITVIIWIMLHDVKHQRRSTYLDPSDSRHSAKIVRFQTVGETAQHNPH